MSREEARRAAITSLTISIAGTHAGDTGCVSDLIEIRDAIRQFIAERDWQQYQHPKSVMLALVGEVGELAELLQWLPAENTRELIAEEPLKTRLGEEVADVLIYLLGLADQCDIDVREATFRKINDSRSKHPVEAVKGVAPPPSLG